MRRLVFGALMAIPCLLLIGRQALCDGVIDLDSLGTRPSLFDYPDSPKDALRSLGVGAEFWVTQFYQGMPVGIGGHTWVYGGKGDAFVTFDGEKLGLWPGLSVSVHQEGVWGENLNFTGGTALWPGRR
ncbi:hypothetical protein [Methylocapsa palsarum]|uniref:Porin n=1 Tax=Methylocapsa palsarum TaxID=1612308 RepID=A0A1I3Z1R9_9HYPH|nr:hypothetical protein [Methylocapsa palsarum]SFK37927.1 porin [Methylocapsa palsarum]